MAQKCRFSQSSSKTPTLSKHSDPRMRIYKRSLFPPPFFIHKNDRLSKTGSGQTHGKKSQKKSFFFLQVSCQPTEGRETAQSLLHVARGRVYGGCQAQGAANAFIYQMHFWYIILLSESFYIFIYICFYCTQNDQFTKTGSGQRQGKLRKGGGVFCRGTSHASLTTRPSTRTSFHKWCAKRNWKIMRVSPQCRNARFAKTV